MKILLASIAFVSPYTYHRRYLGLGYLHAHAISDPKLRDRITIDHLFYDFWAYSHEDIAEHILGTGADLVGFTCYVWNTQHIFKIATLLRQGNPNIKIVLGGPDIKKHYIRVLNENPAVDYIGVGEGEETFRELIHALLDNEPVSKVAGLAHRGPDGPVLLKEREHAKNLDVFESPFLTGVMPMDVVTRGAFFQTSRGCPMRCAYCTWGRESPYAEFSIERVDAEIKYFQEQGAQGMFCVDSNFNQNNERAIKILNSMEKHGLKAGVWVETQPRHLDQPFMEAASRTHLTYIGLGIQSTNAMAMENINRKWDPAKIGALLDGLTAGDNCYPGFDLIMGLPGDDLEAFKSTLSWAYSKNPTAVHIYIFQVLPDAPIAKEKERLKIVDQGPEGQYQILSNYSFPADQIQHGIIMREWSQLLQQVFYRLSKASGIPAGDLLEKWAYFTIEKDLLKYLEALQLHQIDREPLQNLADTFEVFVAQIWPFEAAEDVALKFKEFVRYLYARRRVTREIVTTMAAVDVHGISVKSRFNLMMDKGAFDGKPLPEGGFEESFAADMKKLWPLKDRDGLIALPIEPHTYYFFSNELGKAVALEI